MERLLDRAAETERLQHFVDLAGSGQGSAVVVSGPAGIGKTRLVSHVRETCARVGMMVAAVRCGPLDGELSWSVMRELLDGVDGSSAVRGTSPAELIPSATFAVARAAAERPLLLAVDDIHWADPESVRWLAHLVLRVPELSVAVVVATRDDEPATHQAAHDAIVSSATAVVRPRPLTAAASSAWTTSVLGDVGPEIAEAVYEMTAGSPLLLDQLLTDMAMSEHVNSAAVRAARPRALRDMVRARLRRLDDPARLTAEAVAILGDGAQIGRVAELMALDAADAARAASTLADAHILRDGTPLSFVHPLVMATIYDAIPAVRRQLLHRQAAHLLAQRVGGLERAAHHLLSVDPLPDQHDAALLAEAGQLAVRRHAYGQAAALFSRALDDDLPDDQRGSIEVARARALVLAGRDEGLRAFQEAIAGISDPRAVAELAAEAGHALLVSNRIQDALDAYNTAVRAAAEIDEGLHRRLLAYSAMAGLALRQPPVEVVVAALAQPLPVDRAVLSLACGIAAWGGAPAAESTRLARAALQAPFELGVDGLSWTVDTSFLALALTWAERFDEACAPLERVIAIARERGALIDLAAASAYRAYADLGRGRLAQARTDTELTRRIYDGLATEVALPRAVQLYVLIAIGELAEADALLSSPQTFIDEDQAGVIMFLHARGKLRFAQGRPKEAKTDLERVGRECADRHIANPAAAPWRSDLARVLVALDDRGQAQTLADEEVELARTYGAPGALGRALLAAAIAAPNGDGHLKEALTVLQAARTPLICCDALLTHGMRLRRAGERLRSREPLRAALDIAASCGARPLADLALAELTVAGARPRRAQLTGAASLTVAEQRVAQLAASGRSNPQIASELFLTLRTVETHLTSCYRKLDIAGRSALPDALDPA